MDIIAIAIVIGNISGNVTMVSLLIYELKQPNKLKSDEETHKLPFRDVFYFYITFLICISIQCYYQIIYLLSLYSQEDADRTVWSNTLFATGLVTCIAGSYLRNKAKQQLGAFFTYQLGVNKKQKLITNGLYTHLMHPSYLGACMLLLGISIAYQSLLLFTMFIAFITIVAKVRIPQEETMLATHFGAEYEVYRKNRWRMIPFLY